jgi:tetratricopeptide (TPR) repeat protein
MKHRSKVSAVAALLVLVLLSSSVAALLKVESLRGPSATLEEVLFVPSSQTLKKMSLGYSSLLANIYWTRAVQYFGARLVQNSNRYDLLYPLLDITTDLDPHLIEAYQTGSIFLAQQSPAGAGQPEKAVALVEKGIRANPDYWRLYFTLGFIHYLDRKDYKAAQDAFARGAEVPGALPWMRIMAARMAERSNDIATAFSLWKAVYDNNHDKMVRDSATKHMASLRAEADIQELQRGVQTYRDKTGSLPTSWRDLVRAGILPGIPVDPSGAVYILMPNGAVWVEDTKAMPFIGESFQGSIH